MWDGSPYPAHFLQFGDDRKKIDSVIDQFGVESIKVEDVPVVQCSDVSHQQKNDMESSHQMQNKSSSFAATQKMKAARN
ncbi:hypothetical protein AVEN_130028-1 [Araneus ventricosus]|uniref:Uncharacterized protein n=1 Tax=Araneus ventricosus TaxID=182803 RepID=A0A4Y2Q4J7_ARAVE|nr:hypothetical protein AVEN_130028-1 [Araneus ventricosus]